MNSLERLPDFIAVGPPRTGTTWLHEAFKGRVGLPAGAKETHYFSTNYGKGMAWYLRFFCDCPRALPAGEICASYFSTVEAVQRIRQVAPQCRIICTLRDPVERLYSFYKLMRHDGRTWRSFEEGLERHRGWLERGGYAASLERWRLAFGAERVLVCFYEDLATDPEAYLGRICDFIGIARIKLNGTAMRESAVNAFSHAPRSYLLAKAGRRLRDWIWEHRLGWAEEAFDRAGIWRIFFAGGERFAPLDPATDARLREFFRPEVEQLEAILERDLTAWKTPRLRAA